MRFYNNFLCVILKTKNIYMLKVLFWIFIGPYYLAFKLFTFPISLILKLFVLYGHSKSNFSKNPQSSKKFKYANKTCNNCGLQ